MRCLITGGGGQLGSHLASLLPDAIVPDRSELDLADRAVVAAAVQYHQPDVVINAAANTAVDAAERDESTAMAVNTDGVRCLAQALADVGGRLIHVSTDYVFDGNSSAPYEPDDPTEPRTVYGRTKLAGERAAISVLSDRCVIVRSAWVYGGPSPNFVDTMLRLEREREFVDVVADQTGSPTWVADLAAGLVALVSCPEIHGVLHYANTGTASWFELARETFRFVGANPDRVRPTTSGAFPRPAPRPAWSVLSMRAWIEAGLPAPRPWQDALHNYISHRMADTTSGRETAR